MPGTPAQCSFWMYRLDPQENYYLKFILEAYEGLATLTTVDSQAGLVVLGVPPGSEKAVQALMESLGREMRLERVEEKGSESLATQELQ